MYIHVVSNTLSPKSEWDLLKIVNRSTLFYFLMNTDKESTRLLWFMGDMKGEVILCLSFLREPS